MRTKCCVPQCESKSGSVVFHRLPRTEIGLNKWVKSIGCAKLKKLSSNELWKNRVCHKHFEQRFVKPNSRLKLGAYPTLFTLEEMDSGIPARTQNHDMQVLLDHDYIQTKKQKHNDHNYFKLHPSNEYCTGIDTRSAIPSTSSEELVTNKYMKLEPEKKMLFNPPAMESVTTFEKNQPTVSESTPHKTKKTRFVVQRNLTPKCRRILHEYRKAKKQLNFANRVNMAKKLSKKESFEKLVCNMNPLAKKIFWMQISQCTKATRGRRFSEDEKLIALAILKQSPKSYKFLRRIFRRLRRIK